MRSKDITALPSKQSKTFKYLSNEEPLLAKKMAITSFCFKAYGFQKPVHRGWVKWFLG